MYYYLFFALYVPIVSGYIRTLADICSVPCTKPANLFYYNLFICVYFFSAWKVSGLIWIHSRRYNHVDFQIILFMSPDASTVVGQM